MVSGFQQEVGSCKIALSAEYAPEVVEAVSVPKPNNGSTQSAAEERKFGTDSEHFYK